MIWIIIFGCVAVDILTKYIVVSSMELEASVNVIPGLFDLIYIRNYGAAFSSMQNKRLMLIILTALMMAGLLVYLLAKGKEMLTAERVALAMIIGGGIGNLIDRIRLGYVVDFIKTSILPFIDFPVYNFADICVTLGCVLLMIAVIFEDKIRERRK